MKTKNSPGWEKNQNDEYRTIVKNRLGKENLAWVGQVIGLIEGHVFADGNTSVKNIGCRAVQFYKQIEQRGLKWNYCGCELEQAYFDVGLHHFLDLRNAFDWAILSRKNRSEERSCRLPRRRLGMSATGPSSWKICFGPLGPWWSSEYFWAKRSSEIPSDLLLSCKIIRYVNLDSRICWTWWQSVILATDNQKRLRGFSPGLQSSWHREARCCAGAVRNGLH